MAYQSISVDHHGDDQEAINLNGSSEVGIRPQNQRRIFSITLAIALIGICYYFVHHHANDVSIGNSSIISTTDSYTSKVHKQLDNGHHLPPLPTGV